MVGPHSAMYRWHLKSPDWALLRERVITAQGNRCRGCGRLKSHPIGTPLELHHLHYDTLGRERPSDVVALCVFCHEVADQERAAKTKARTWAARVSGWAEAVGWSGYGVEEAFEEWLEGVES